MRRISKLGIVGSGVCALALTLSSPAFADYAPQASDVVGVGSDTVQNIGNFIADGDYSFDPGYNGVGASNKLISFDATPDENDRAGYLNGSTSAALKPLNPTIILRAGTSPVLRPNGSGAGISALLADHGSTGYVNKINYVRMSRLPSAAEEQTAGTNLGTPLRVIQLSTDPLEVAYATANSTGTAITSNIPAAGLTVQQLAGIYKCTYTTWSQVGGTGPNAGNTIIPLLPQVGSGTHDTFLTDILGSKSASVGGCVQFVEENDPTALTGAMTQGTTPVADPADAIAPFSAGRLALWNDGYFKSPSVPFGTTPTTLVPGVAVENGFQSNGTTPRTVTWTPPGTSTPVTANVYDDVRGLYVVFRASDVGDPTKAVGTAGAEVPWQSGSTQDWAHTLFVNTPAIGSNPAIPCYVDQSFNSALISDAGVTPAYSDLGNNP